MSLVHVNASYLRAEAVDRKNRVIGSTGVMDLHNGKLISMETAFSIELDDTDYEMTWENEGSTLAAWDVSRNEKEWRTMVELFMILGLCLSISCLAYGLIPWIRSVRRGQQYSPL